MTSGLRTFFIIWGGQLVSILGSEMTSFAVTIWAWETTGQATPLALILFFTRLTKVITAIFGGIVVDRFSRKRIMIFSDCAIASGTESKIRSRFLRFSFYSYSGQEISKFGTFIWLP